MRHRSALPALGLAGLLATAAAPQPDPATAQETTRFFDEACLRSFPDDAATLAFAAAHKGVALTPGEVKRYLHDDPGRGWYVRTTLGLYALTVEAPPFHACSIRRMTDIGIADAKPFLADIEAFVAARHLTLVRQAPVKRVTPQGVNITMFPLAAMDASGALADNLMLILTNYHGKIPDEFRADGGRGPGVEVRMVVQHPPPQAPPAPASPPSPPIGAPAPSPTA